MDISTILGMGLALLLMVFGMIFDATTMGFDFGKIGKLHRRTQRAYCLGWSISYTNSQLPPKLFQTDSKTY